RQRQGERRHLRRGRAGSDHRRGERHDRSGDRREALAGHRGCARRAVERALHGELAHRGHVSLGGDREETGRSMSAPVRVAVVGAGAIAQVAHLPVLRKLPGVEVAAICDNDVSKAQALAARFEVKDTFDDIEEVLRYSHADVVAVRGFLAGGDLGALQAIRSGWYTFQPSRQQLGWRLRRPEAGGGAFLDLGLQLLDLGLWLAGWPAPKRVAAHMMRQAKDAV